MPLIDHFSFIPISFNFCITFIQLEYDFSLNESTLELVERYNDVISTIAETFVRYDEMLKAIEEAKASNTNR